MSGRPQREISGRFNSLRVVGEAPKIIFPSGQERRAFNCLCDCGNYTTVEVGHLTKGTVKSCGCLKTAHPDANRDSPLFPLYNTWSNNFRQYPYEHFRDWALDKGWQTGKRFERKDLALPFSKRNCLITEQATLNYGRTSTFRYKGRKDTLAVILEQEGLAHKFETVRSRLKLGWSIKDAVETPIHDKPRSTTT